MARYRKIDVRIWGDEKFQALSGLEPSGKALWLYLLTSPSTNSIPGLFRAGEAAMAEELEWPLKAFREAFGEVFRQGLAEADWKARVIWIPNALKYNRPESPNVVASWAVSWDEIPECRLKHIANAALRDFTEGLGEAFAKAFAKACPKPSGKAMPNQEQEQEQDKEQEQDRSLPGVAAAPPLASPAVLTFTTQGKEKSWPLTQAQVDAWRELYPGLEVIVACRKALAWTEANPAKRKTAKGMPAFLVNWLNREANSGGGRNGTKPRTPSEERRTWGTDAGREAHYESQIVEFKVPE